MPHPAPNPPRPSPSPPTCPRCGNRLPVRGDRIGSCPLCRETTSIGNRSTQTNIDILTAPDSPVLGVAYRPAHRWILFVSIVLLAVIGALVYYLA